MLTSLALVFLLGLAAAALCSRIGLPRIIGMLLTGILIGPYVLNWLDDSILSISPALRQMALSIILIKAGLSLNLSDLKKVGRPAVMMSCVPASCEILAFFLLAPHILGINRIEAAVMGAVLGAVSPAVVVPRMVQLMEEKRGTGQGIPQMILAGASCDDIYVIVLFSTFVGMAQGGSANMMDFVNIPVSIVLGVALGAAVGLLLHLFLETAYRHGCYVRNSTKVMSMACVLKIKSPEKVTKRLSAKFGKLWIAAEAILFVLVGAAVDIRCAVQAGAAAVLMIALALVFRAVGVSICMLGTGLNRKERLFCVIAYLPKATVQAAIGSVPLSMGLPCGQLVLSVAVLAILITAPLGAIGIDRTAGRLLVQESPSDIAE